MLCPEVSSFPPPKVISSCKKFENLGIVTDTLKINNFYKSLIVTCPDELQIPVSIEECITEDNDYYKIMDCSVTEFFESTFVEKFIKNGKLYCLSADRNCIVQNCAAITPDGTLTLHIPEYIYQTLGIEGTKRPHDFYELKIYLNCHTKYHKLVECLKKLEHFDFYIFWDPNQENICPSSLARYFYERNISVTVHTLDCKILTPTVSEIPSVKDVEPSEMMEWLGMLVHGADLTPTEDYISTYTQPESGYALKSSRICVLVAKGFITSSIITNVCRKLHDYVATRELDHYWASVGIQSNENSLWQWTLSSPCMFQAHNSSCNVFFTSDSQIMYLIGQLKYS